MQLKLMEVIAIAIVAFFIGFTPFAKAENQERHTTAIDNQVSEQNCPGTWPNKISGEAYAFFDPRSGITLYLESDRRHIAAISPAGKLLWLRDPFADAHLEPYRTAHPRIVQFAPFQECEIQLRKMPVLRDHFIFVGFDSSQFGSLDALTGDFIFEGQN